MLPLFFSTSVKNSVSPININNIGGSGSSEYYDGILDEIRIYNRALSESEIQQLYKVEE
jgi:hypothetical protein